MVEHTPADFTEGFIPFNYQGETYQTYWKLFGNLDDRKRTPLVVLHGGPGLSHDYLVPLGDLWKTHGIPVILYDQLGNSRSTHLKDKPPSFWSVDVFLDELENILKHFEIEGGFNLLGHSWGGICVSELAVQRQPAGLKHLVLTNTLPSFELWIQSTMQLLQSFPTDVQQGIATGMKDPPTYYAALKAFHAQHGCRVKPLPREVVYSFEVVFGPDGDPTVSSAPLLKDWTIIDRLHLIKISTLVINGRLDIAQDFVCAPFFYKIPKAKWIRFEDSSHMPFWEERERYISILGDFLVVDE